MLYVFLVGSGTMTTFDMNLACGDVAALQKAIQRRCGIPEDQQVLLVSGGIALNPKAKVIEYSAGTDTNPIFLCTRSGVDTGYGSYYEDEQSSYINVEERVVACEGMTYDYQTLATRSQLAQDLAQLGNEELSLCNQLVDSQHLQHQGWLAVIANLEDELKSLHKTFDTLKVNAHEYFQSRPLYQGLLNNFRDAVNRLERVPLLPAFVTECEDVEKRTLLSKFASEPSSSLKEIASHCQKWTEQFSEETLELLRQEVVKLQKDCRESELKEIPGIEDWLYKLNEKISEARKYSGEQHKFAKSFLNHQNRLSTMSEPSILQDLCLSHNAELRAMLKTHLHLTQIHEQCKNAKMKLSMNLQSRISWVATIECVIFHVKNKLAIYNLNLNRLQHHLGIIEQMHIAPERYVKTLVEIRRRKMFSIDFLKWAASISEFATDVHQKEVGAREFFKKSKSQNFIDSLFPGMDDIPPPFATSCPEPFDTLLPSVTEEDLENLKQVLPEFANFIDVPHPDIIQQTSHKSIGTDSAFSSEVPSSQALTVPSQTCASCRTNQLSHAITLSSSTGGDAVSSQPEIPSPVFSPSNDVAGTESQMKHRLESTKAAGDSAERDLFSPIAEEQNNVESDVEEFETVDSLPKCTYDPFTAPVTVGDAKSATENIEQSVATNVPDPTSPKSDKKAELLRSTCEERLRSPDSMLTSHDFCSADYFFDDSMPSSYTESTGLSAAGKGQQMVKSHHVIVAELQHQLDNKTSALIGAEGSLPMSRSSADILKLHATLSAFQKFCQELRVKFGSDLKTLKEDVMYQRLLVNDELVYTVQRVETSLALVNKTIDEEREKAVSEALVEERLKNEQILKKCELEREVQMHKLEDSNREIEIYRKQIQQLRDTMEELKQDFASQLLQVQEDHKAHIEELKRDLEMEHELELNSIKQEMVRYLAGKEHEVAEKTKSLTMQIESLSIEKENQELEHKKHLAKEVEELTKRLQGEKVDAFQQSEDISRTSRGTYTCTDGVLKIAGPGALQIAPALEEIHSEALLNALNNEQLYVHLSEEITRIWRVLHKNFDGKFSAPFSRKFVEKIQSIVVDLVEQHLLVSEETVSGDQCQVEEIVAQQQFAFLQLLTDLKTNKEFNENKQVSSVSEALDMKASLLSVLDQCTQVFNTWGATSVYNSYYLNIVDAEKKERLQEIATLNEELNQQNDNHMEAIERLKSVHIAENQVTFNEAINKVTREKDEVISALRKDLFSLERKRELESSVLNSYMDKYRQSANSQETGDSRPLELSVLVYKALLEIMEKIEQPSAAIITSPTSPDSSSSSMSSYVKGLEKELKKEKCKLNKIFEKINKAPELKMSVLTCDPGECVLFCYNDKCKHYVAFHFGPIAHFLHEESVKVLQLKIPPDSPKTTWAVGIIIEKECYMAKKKTNRFNLRSGSMFYFVKVKPWEKGVEMRKLYAGKDELSVSEVSQFPCVSSPDSAIDQPSTSKADKMSASTI